MAKLARRSGGSSRRHKDVLPGAFQWLIEAERAAIAEIDERRTRIEGTVAATKDDSFLYVVEVDEHDRARRLERIKRMQAVESQLVPVADVRGLPGAELIGWLQRPDLPELTAEQYGLVPATACVFPDDTVQVGQSRAQRAKQAELVGLGLRRGRITDKGDYQPIAFNAETRTYQDIRPGDSVVFGGVISDAREYVPDP